MRDVALRLDALDDAGAMTARKIGESPLRAIRTLNYCFAAVSLPYGWLASRRSSHAHDGPHTTELNLNRRNGQREADEYS
jgi:hypothetical protein